MKDANIVKAFIAALAQLNEPLPAEVQQQIQDIGKTERFSRLSLLAKQHKPLETAYQQARLYLVEHSNQQRKTSHFVPDATAETKNTDSTETDNVSMDTSKCNDCKQVLKAIEANLQTEEPAQPWWQPLKAKAKEILCSQDAQESAKKFVYPDIPSL